PRWQTSTTDIPMRPNLRPIALLPAAALALSLAACNPQSSGDASTAQPETGATADAASQADAAFADLSQRWLDGAMRLSPVSATQIGDHRFDSDIGDLGADGRQEVVDFNQALLAELDAIDAAQLSR